MKRLLTLLLACLSTLSFARILREGGELGNGRSVDYPIIGISTVRPEKWSDMESLGAVKLFESGFPEGREPFVYFEAARSDGLTDEAALEQMVAEYFQSPKSQIVESGSMVFAFAETSKDPDYIRGCAWDPSKNRNLCFTAFSPQRSGRAAAVRLILKKLRFL